MMNCRHPVLIYEIFMTFAIDFGLPEMYLSNVGMSEALKKVFENIKKQKLESLVYYLAKIVFGIAVVLLGALVLVVVVLVALLPGFLIFFGV